MRKMRKPLIALVLVALILLAQLVATAPARKSLRTQLNANYVRAMAAYRKLQPRLSSEELRAITTIGILNGAKKAEQEMEKHLVDVVKDLVLHTDMNDKEIVVPKIEKIEKQLERDKHALEILTSAMDLATRKKSVRDFKQEMQQMWQQTHGESSEPVKEGDDVEQPDENNIANRVAALRQNILKQVHTMKKVVEGKIETTLDYLIDKANEDDLLGKASNKVVRKRDVSSELEEPAEIRMIKTILTEDDFRTNLVQDGIDKRKDEFDSLENDLDLHDVSKQVPAKGSSRFGPGVNATRNISTTTVATKSAKQEEASPDNEPSGENIEGGEGGEGGAAGGNGGGGTGLVGIITSLSGGEGGSDIGALLGALTGLVSTLFGPGGLDVESLISSGTSLISGLLAGNKNFGTVLGNYVGTAFDGLSGGGGAVNNGKFIGEFLGTVVASLSADPEEDDEPPKPFLFAQNLISSFIEAKNRKNSDDESEERKGHNNNKEGAAVANGGSDSSAFIKHIVSHLVQSAVSFVLNAAVGASGGASHASSGLFTASSAGHKKPAGGKDS